MQQISEHLMLEDGQSERDMVDEASSAKMTGTRTLDAKTSMVCQHLCCLAILLHCIASWLPDIQTRSRQPAWSNVTACLQHVHIVLL